MDAEKREQLQLKLPFDLERAVSAQEAWARRCRVPLRRTDSLGVESILVPPGEFRCGATKELNQELKRQGFSKIDEPSFDCVLTKPMYVGIHRITQNQYWKLMGTNPSAYAASGYLASHVEGLDTWQFPVEGVSWYDCIEACNNMSEREGLPAYYRFGEFILRNSSGAIFDAEVEIIGGTGYRLLTSAEWEWVARAGTSTVYFYGNEERRPDWKVDIGRPWPVGAEASNHFGIYDLDMFRNEWVFDAYSYEDQVEGPLIDPVDLENEDNERVARAHDSFHRSMEIAGAAESCNFRFCRTIEVEAVRRDD